MVWEGSPPAPRFLPGSWEKEGWGYGQGSLNVGAQSVRQKAEPDAGSDLSLQF